MNLTDLTTIKSVCKRYGLAPNKGKGQNFLVDREALDEIVMAADLKPEDTVLEIGPGPGALTTELAKRVKTVVAVELDKRAVEMLKETTREHKNVKIIQSDILKISRQDLESLVPEKYKVVSNLPYNITSVFFRKFLSELPQPSEIAVMVQKEVAERIASGPGKMSLLSLSVQFYGEPEITCLVPKTSFWPAPKVDSAILKISRVGQGFSEKMTKEETKAMFRLAKIGFSARRKQLQNNLAAGLRTEREKIGEILEGLGLNPLARAQDLGVGDWMNLTKRLK